MSEGQVAVVETVTIERPADEVRRQFADVAHHEATGVHRGVRFEVVAETDGLCRYRQTARIGPIPLVQEFELDRTVTGPLVNRITGGSFAGGSITFDVAPAGETASTVTARLEGPVPPPRVLLAPILRAIVARSLRRALDEDRIDLESGAYERAAGGG